MTVYLTCRFCGKGFHVGDSMVTDMFECTTCGKTCHCPECGGDYDDEGKCQDCDYEYVESGYLEPDGPEWDEGLER